MSLTDSPKLREFLLNLYPGLIIDSVPAPSGQRVVYFCHFDSTFEELEWVEWGDVVLKISEGQSAQGIAYIQAEIEILKNLTNPGYPELLFDEVIINDPITEEKLPYKRYITIEEKIDSSPLSEVATNFDNEEAVITLLLKIIYVLRPLWERNPSLIHRDLKPQNILITPDDDVVIIDLGIVREEGSAGVTNSAIPFGPCTPNYASPEQASNDKKNITFRSDVFALGTLSYELLAGFNPFSKETNLRDEILQNVIDLEPESLHALGVCSEEFSQKVGRMMEKQAYKRYRKIDDLVGELEGMCN